jgi:hypothetical protein
MKNSFWFLSLLFLLPFFSVNAQFISAGLRLGINNSMDLDDLKLAIADKQSFTLAMNNSNFGYHFAGLVRVKLGPLFLQPELIFNSNSFDISWKELGKAAVNVGKQKFQYLEIPVLAGLKLGPIRINAGPSGHLFLNKTGDLFKINNYSVNFSGLTLGYTAGVGFDIGKFMMDLRYDGNFSDPDGTVNFIKDFDISNRPPKIIGSVGFRF